MAWIVVDVSMVSLDKTRRACVEATVVVKMARPNAPRPPVEVVAHARSNRALSTDKIAAMEWERLAKMVAVATEGESTVSARHSVKSRFITWVAKTSQ